MTSAFAITVSQSSDAIDACDSEAVAGYEIKSTPMPDRATTPEADPVMEAARQAKSTVLDRYGSDARFNGVGIALVDGKTGLKINWSRGPVPKGETMVDNVPVRHVVIGRVRAL